MTCPKCQSAMQEGYLLDKQHGPHKEPGQWVEGQPQRAFLIGLTLGDHDHREIQIYRCVACGYLESYAK